MKIYINRDALLKPLQIVSGAVERRHTLPILGNVLIQALDGEVSFVATDMEVELVARTRDVRCDAGEATVPARKLMDICRALPSEAEVEMEVSEGRARIRSGRSRFSLATLPASDFPSTEVVGEEGGFALPGHVLKGLLEHTQFAMAQQDVRYYLNGLLLESRGPGLRAVATDGHRLALCEVPVDGEALGEGVQIIVPRKGVLELVRLLADSAEVVKVTVGSQAVQVVVGDVRLTSKLVDGRFPDYERVVPDAEACDKHVVADREALRQGLQRAAILANEKYRAVRVSLSDGLLRVLAHNPEQEEAEEEVEVTYAGGALEIGFNVSYLIDALSAIGGHQVRLDLSDGNSSCLIRSVEGSACEYVVMPMRL